ncbi:MAG: hypothetical protein DRQ47_08660, partial [Gammaproteobacteria bacterium]
AGLNDRETYADEAAALRAGLGPNVDMTKFAEAQTARGTLLDDRFQGALEREQLTREGKLTQLELENAPALFKSEQDRRAAQTGASTVAAALSQSKIDANKRQIEQEGVLNNTFNNYITETQDSKKPASWPELVTRIHKQDPTIGADRISALKQVFDEETGINAAKAKAVEDTKTMQTNITDMRERVATDEQFGIDEKNSINSLLGTIGRTSGVLGDLKSVTPQEIYAAAGQAEGSNWFMDINNKEIIGKIKKNRKKTDVKSFTNTLDAELNPEKRKSPASILGNRFPSSL